MTNTFNFKFPMLVKWVDGFTFHYGIATGETGDGSFVIATNTQSFFKKKLKFSKIANATLADIEHDYNAQCKTSFNLFQTLRFSVLINTAKKLNLK